jgi:hypothetical protein
MEFVNFLSVFIQFAQAMDMNPNHNDVNTTYKVKQIGLNFEFTHDANSNRISMNRPSVNLPLLNEITNTSYNNANQPRINL